MHAWSAAIIWPLKCLALFLHGQGNLIIKTQIHSYLDQGQALLHVVLKHLCQAMAKIFLNFKPWQWAVAFKVLCCLSCLAQDERQEVNWVSCSSCIGSVETLQLQCCLVNGILSAHLHPAKENAHFVVTFVIPLLVNDVLLCVDAKTYLCYYCVVVIISMDIFR